MNHLIKKPDTDNETDDLLVDIKRLAAVEINSVLAIIYGVSPATLLQTLNLEQADDIWQTLYLPTLTVDINELSSKGVLFSKFAVIDNAKHIFSVIHTFELQQLYRQTIPENFITMYINTKFISWQTDTNQPIIEGYTDDKTKYDYISIQDVITLFGNYTRSYNSLTEITAFDANDFKIINNLVYEIELCGKNSELRKFLVNQMMGWHAELRWIVDPSTTIPSKTFLKHFIGHFLSEYVFPVNTINRFFSDKYYDIIRYYYWDYNNDINTEPMQLVNPVDNMDDIYTHDDVTESANYSEFQYNINKQDLTLSMALEAHDRLLEKVTVLKQITFSELNSVHRLSISEQQVLQLQTTSLTQESFVEISKQVIEFIIENYKKILSAIASVFILVLGLRANSTMSKPLIDSIRETAVDVEKNLNNNDNGSSDFNPNTNDEALNEKKEKIHKATEELLGIIQETGMGADFMMQTPGFTYSDMYYTLKAYDTIFKTFITKQTTILSIYKTYCSSVSVDNLHDTSFGYGKAIIGEVKDIFDPLFKYKDFKTFIESNASNALLPTSPSHSDGTEPVHKTLTPFTDTPEALMLRLEFKRATAAGVDIYGRSQPTKLEPKDLLRHALNLTKEKEITNKMVNQLIRDIKISSAWKTNTLDGVKRIIASITLPEEVQQYLTKVTNLPYAPFLFVGNKNPISSCLIPLNNEYIHASRQTSKAINIYQNILKRWDRILKMMNAVSKL